MSLSSQNTFELTPGRRPIYSHSLFYHFSNKQTFQPDTKSWNLHINPSKCFCHPKHNDSQYKPAWKDCSKELIWWNWRMLLFHPIEISTLEYRPYHRFIHSIYSERQFSEILSKGSEQRPLQRAPLIYRPQHQDQTRYKIDLHLRHA